MMTYDHAVPAVRSKKRTRVASCTSERPPQKVCRRDSVDACGSEDGRRSRSNSWANASSASSADGFPFTSARLSTCNTNQLVDFHACGRPHNWNGGFAGVHQAPDRSTLVAADPIAAMPTDLAPPPSQQFPADAPAHLLPSNLLSPGAWPQAAGVIPATSKQGHPRLQPGSPAPHRPPAHACHAQHVSPSSVVAAGADPRASQMHSGMYADHRPAASTHAAQAEIHGVAYEPYHSEAAPIAADGMARIHGAATTGSTSLDSEVQANVAQIRSQSRLAQSPIAAAAAPPVAAPAPATAAPIPGAVPHAAAVAEWTVDVELRRAILVMVEDERNSPIDADYMTQHGREVMGEGLWITPTMRFMTINWMSEAMHDLQLSPNVTMMAITLLDRYLSHARYFPRTMLQLAAAACIFVSAKIEGKLPHPRGSDIAALADGAFDLSHLVTFERTLCQTLNFNLYGPSSQHFLDIWRHALPPRREPIPAYYAQKVHVLASYLLELAALVYDMLNRSRSVTAAAALLLAYADPGLHRAVAERLELPTTEIAALGHGMIGAARSSFGPVIDGEELVMTMSELVRLLGLSLQPERRELFVILKFGSRNFDHIADIAQPLNSEQFRSVVQLFFSGA